MVSIGFPVDHIFPCIQHILINTPFDYKKKKMNLKSLDTPVSLLIYFRVAHYLLAYALEIPSWSVNAQSYFCSMYSEPQEV